MSYKQILTTNDIGTGTNQIAAGNHNHDSTYVKKINFLGEGTDLNNILDSGFYRLQTGTNFPSEVNFGQLINSNGYRDGINDSILQICGSFVNKDFYIRGASLPITTTWHRITLDDDLNNVYVKKSGDTMTGMLQFSGISTANFTEGIRINKAADGWTSICLGGSASSGCSAETWSMHTLQNGESADFWLTHNGSNGSTDNTGCLRGQSNGEWYLNNQLTIRNPTGTGYIQVQKSDTSSALMLHFDADGTRGLWDTLTSKRLIGIDSSNNGVCGFPIWFTHGGNSLHNLNGWYNSDLTSRFFSSALEIRENGLVGSSQSDIGYAPSIGFHWSGRCAGTLCLRNDAVLQWYAQSGALGTFQAGAVWGAVWNDYAEFRKAESIEPGRCVIEHSSAEMKLSTERLQPGAEIISDTFGFAIGETDECKTPIASSGRVLAYPYEDRNSYPLGAAVCSGPNGTISLMTREEIKEYPERIIGTVSEIPNYEEWGTGKVKVNGRIWIRIR